MIADTYPDVRYNAATTLARLGDAAAVPVLVEMLDPIDTAGVTAEKEEGSRDYKRTAIHINALRAVIELAQHNSSVDVTQLRTAIEKLRAAKPSKAVDVEAIAAIESLKRA
jgi:HEAT repeat protein